MADEQTLEFLWKLFCIHLADASSERLDMHISTMYDAPLDLDNTVEAFIDGFVLNHDRKLLDMAVIETVKQRYFSVDRHVQLVAIEVEKGLISIEDSVALLMVCRSDLRELPELVEQALEVVWLVNEDRRDGFMKADDDHLLKDALSRVAVDFLNSLSIRSHSSS